MLGLTYQQIAVNLCVDTSTVWRAVKQFDDEGTVAAIKNKGYYKLSDYEEFASSCGEAFHVFEGGL